MLVPFPSSTDAIQNFHQTTTPSDHSTEHWSRLTPPQDLCTWLFPVPRKLIPKIFSWLTPLFTFSPLLATSEMSLMLHTLCPITVLSSLWHQLLHELILLSVSQFVDESSHTQNNLHGKKELEHLVHCQNSMVFILDPENNGEASQWRQWSLSS